LRQRLNQVYGVAFVAPELRPNRMSVDCYPQACLFLGCRGLLVALVAGVSLTDACGLTSKSTEVVKLGSSDAASLYKIDVIDDGRVQWKDSFNADAETRFSNGNGFARAAMFAGDYDAFKSLQSLFGLGFFNSHVNTDRIAWLKLWKILPQLGLFDIIQSVHF